MRSVCVALLVAAALVGVAYGQSESFVSAVTAVVDSTDLFNGISTANNCQGDAKEFVKGCSFDISAVVGEDFTSLFDASTQAINAQGVLNALNQLSPDQINQRCCSPACRIAKNGCGCDPNSYNALVAAFGGNTDITGQLVSRIESLCNSKFPSNPFQATVLGTPQCAAEFEATAQSFVCP